MPNSSAVFKLPDHAIVIYFAILEYRTAEVEDLCRYLDKSTASIYRSLAVLRDAGILVKRERLSIAGNYELAN